MTALPSSSRPRPGRRSGVVNPERATWTGRAAARLVHAAVLGMDASLRYRWDVATQAEEAIAAGPVIFAIWHNRLALCLRLYDRFVRRRFPQRRLAAMVSASRDGGLLARVLELFQVQPVRGSSSRRGPQAMLELTSWAKRGCDLALTPDGPRGPRYVVQEGVVAAAQLTGFAIIPVSFALGWKRELRSWDRFQVPLPFSRVQVWLGEPVWVPAEADETERSRSRRLVEERLQSLTRD